MEWFEKEFRKRFEDESTLEGVESGPLWEQISKSIPQAKGTKKPIYWKWTLLIIVSVGVILSLVLMQDSTIENEDHILSSEKTSGSERSKVNKNDSENNSENDVLIIGENNSVNSRRNTKQEFENISIANSKLLEIEPKSSVGATLEKSTALNNKAIINKSGTSELNASSSLNDGISTRAILKGQFNSTYSTTNNKHNNDSDGISNVNKPIDSQSFLSETMSKEEDEIPLTRGSSINDFQARGVMNIQQLAFLKSSILSKKEYINIPAVLPTKILVLKKSPWAIGLHSSANFFSLKYNDDVNPELFAAEANKSIGPLQIGNRIGVTLEYVLNNNWSLSSGIEYSNYENKLSTVLVSDTMVLDDLQKIRRAQNVRSVAHHNKLSTFSIPLLISYNHQISKNWSIGAAGGASYSITRSQRGRLLGRNKIILDYSQNEKKHFGNFISFRANPYIRYHISNQISLDLNAGLSYQRHGLGEVLDLTFTSMIYNIGIGMRYKF